VFSTLHKDQLFGISLQKLQELHKEPLTIQVDVNLSGSGSRRVTVSAKQESRRSQGTIKSNTQSLQGSRNPLKRNIEGSSFPATARS
jgi:inner membrane protein involved in colicin E2 resistance